MSRLENHQQKKFFTKIVFLFLVLIFILYFIFTIGFRLILTTSSFIASFHGKKTQPQTINKNDIYGLIDIDSIPTATNSSRFIISGSVTNFDTLEFYINEEIVKKIDLNSSDLFSEEIGDLIEGQNTVYVKAISSDLGSSKKSNEYTILYKPQKPKLEIKEPNDKSTVTKSEIKISGSTDIETFVKINDMPIVVDAHGNFEILLKLNEGENQIIITAQDIAGNQETKTISVTYHKD